MSSNAQFFATPSKPPPRMRISDHERVSFDEMLGPGSARLLLQRMGDRELAHWRVREGEPHTYECKVPEYDDLNVILALNHSTPAVAMVGSLRQGINLELARRRCNQMVGEVVARVVAYELEERLRVHSDYVRLAAPVLQTVNLSERVGVRVNMDVRIRS